MSQQRRQARDEDVLDEEIRQYVTADDSLEKLNEKYPNRPRNHGKTLLFSDLCTSLFDKLNAPRNSNVSRFARRKETPHEYRRKIIEAFIAKWRSQAGNDFFPAMRLILPESDRERAMYKIKEQMIARILIKVLMIDHSADAESLLHWKRLTGGSSAQQQVAGDFPSRCYQVLSKRPLRREAGDLTVADVNEMLNKLSIAAGEKDRLEIFGTFYRRMCPDELQWLIRIILKQVKIGATEKTILELWHPDAVDLFNVSWSLRRVCWELYDPQMRLTSEQTTVTLMQSFLPQLAYYEMSTSFDKMVAKLNSSTHQGNEETNNYWIEEKLDGERMQLHMVEDDDVPGGKRFAFWSRQAKDYTDIYGYGFHQQASSLTRFLKNAFASGVRNIILDGEMMVWDPSLQKFCKFGTLKTAALSILGNPDDLDAPRPLFRVFDILLLNDQPLAQYTLRDRRNALTRAVLGEPWRLEIHKYVEATNPDEIAPMLRKIVSDASEGLVIKNPRSMYTVGERKSDWIKVKPEYMKGFGHEVDVVVIGGYYGSGSRGGRLSSYMCGLRVPERDIKAGDDPATCYSFTKVGGGFRVEDYAEIQRLTEGKWRDWDVKKPPSKYIRLAGGDKYQYERPDVWIHPSDSVVITVKAASIEETKSFASKFTFRFPRFRQLRTDRSWDTALDYEQFEERRLAAVQKKEEKAFEREERRRKTKRLKKEVVIVGQESVPVAFSGPQTKVFSGLEICILSDSTAPTKKSKAQLETIVRENGGSISQRANPSKDMILVADKKVVKVASLLKEDAEVDIIRPKWLLDCIKQGTDNFLLPYERDHLFNACDATKDAADENTDEFGDSYARDLDTKELKLLLQDMPKKEIINSPFDREAFTRQLIDHGYDLSTFKSHILRDMVFHLAVEEGVPSIQAQLTRNRVRFGGGLILDDLKDASISHIVILSRDEAGETKTAANVRSIISSRHPFPRVVSAQWVTDCLENRTVVDEERYAPS
ncbi:DNA ligase I [Xylariaceae sp. FL0255]|nr:DNA ligase I [Xylariaceae sp. FL0255]